MVKNSGTYVGIRYRNIDLIYKIFQSFLPGIKICPKDSIHTTLFYAKNQPFVDAGSPLKGQIIVPEKPEFELLGDRGECLVYSFRSRILQDEHERIKKMGLVHSFDVFVPHITLSYDYSGIHPSHLIAPFIKDLIVDEEYSDPIDENWSEYNVQR